MSKKKHRGQPNKQAPKNQPPSTKLPANKVPYVVLLCVALAFSALMLSPLLRSAFLGDDADTALTTPAALEYMNTSISELTLDSFTRWVTQEGRLYPLSLYVQPLFYLVRGNLLAFKTIILMLILACIGLFSWLVRRVSRSDALGLAAAVAPTLCFQFMYYYDSMLGFAGMLQMVFLYMTGSLLLFTFYLDGGKRSYLIWSVVLYLASLLTYEITFPFFLLHVLLAWFYPEKRTPKEAAIKSWPLGVTAVTLAAGLVVWRVIKNVSITAASAAASPYAISFSVGKYLRALLIQFVGAWPLTYSSFGSTTWGRTDLFLSPFGYIAKYPLTSLLAFAGYAALAWLFALAVLREPKRKASGNQLLNGLLWLGLAQIVLAGSMIALSPRWQGELVWGVAYLPVFAAYFGSALVLLVLAYRLVRALGAVGMGKIAAGVLAVVVGLVGMTNMQNNRAVVTEWDSWRYGRDAVAQAAEKGIFGSDVNSLLIVNNQINSRQPWDAPQFYAEHGARFKNGIISAASVDVKVLEQTATNTTQESDGSTVFHFAEPKRVFFVEYTGDAASAYVVAQKVTSVAVSGNAITGVAMEPIGAYLVGPKDVGFDGFLAPTKTLVPAASLQSLGLDPAKFQQEYAGADAILYRRAAPSAAESVSP